MKKQGILRFAALIISVALIICGMPVSADNQNTVSLTGDEYVKVASNESLELYVRPSVTDFYVKNLKDGSVWYSCVQDITGDPYIGGIYMTEVRALVSLIYYDEDGIMNNINSYASSVLDGNFVLEAKENGYRVTYTLEQGIFELPLEIVLEDDGLSVEVKTSEIKIESGYSISSVSVLPFFSSGSRYESGYILIPDGCGGIIDFETDKSGIAEYSKRVYGTDISNSEATVAELDDATPISLPVFGIKRGESAMLCLIEQGEAMAYINAYGAGNITAQNNVYASFALYSNMEYTFSANSTIIFEDNTPLCDICEKYWFLSGEEANYSGMAGHLRNKLIQGGILEENDIKAQPYLTLYGGITVKKSVFGILTDSVAPLTTTEQVVKIADEADELRISSPVITYRNWNSYELKGKSAVAVKIDRRIKAGGVSLDDLAASEKFTFVPMISDILSYTKSGGIIAKFNAPASNIAGTALYKEPLSQTTLLEYGDRIYYLGKKYLNKNLKKLTKSIARIDGQYIGFSDLSCMLYEDFSKDTMKRYRMQELVTDTLQSVSDDKRLVLDNPNFYALTFADRLINIPMSTGGHLMIDREVPFYQMVIAGCIGYSSPPLNYTDENYALLKLAETGSMPHYFAYYAKESTVKNTEYSDLGGGDYEKNLKKLSALYSELSALWDTLVGGYMTSHECIADDVYKVEYSTGVCLYVNYSENDYITPGGNSVTAGNYLTEVA